MFRDLVFARWTLLPTWREMSNRLQRQNAGGNNFRGKTRLRRWGRAGWSPIRWPSRLDVPSESHAQDHRALLCPDKTGVCILPSEVGLAGTKAPPSRNPKSL